MRTRMRQHDATSPTSHARADTDADSHTDGRARSADRRPLGRVSLDVHTSGGVRRGLMGQRIRSQAPQLLRREAAKKTMHAGMPRVPARPTATTTADHVIEHHTTPIAFWKKSLLTYPV